ncbi:Nif3-like dinuclear metal center hexameric protein [Corallincola luteus]|nr:Nif3-like dinuclear metal center hexameric protein [Corallincola luteus]
MSTAMDRKTLIRYLDDFLVVDQFRDYCPNGLQVEGSPVVQNVVTGVTASAALIDKAIALKADTLLVHHGYFWKGESPEIVGIKANRIRKLIQNNINLVAYHLPLDAHPVVGNNAQLAKLLGIAQTESSDPTSVLATGAFSPPIKSVELAERLSQTLNRAPLHSAVVYEIKSVAWCTGGGQDFIEQAADLGCDAFISGEVSERTVLLSRELGIDFFAAGHHATERYGIKALGEHLNEKFGLDVSFVDIDNPA